MPLNDFFRKGKPAPVAPSGKFWEDVAGLCRTHVERQMAFFASRRADHWDWAEPRFRALVAPAALDRLMENARAVLSSGAKTAVFPPLSLGVEEGWFVYLSVYPSAADADFVAAAPGGTYEVMARSLRTEFRKRPGWQDADMAFWILLLNEAAHQASIHLQTFWSIHRELSWFIPPGPQGPARLASAPSIVPVDLIKEDVFEFLKTILQEDAANLK